MSRLVISFLLALGTFVCTSALLNVGKAYSLVMVGGGLYDNNTDVWERIIDLGGGKGVARFGVISAASEVRC